VSRLDAEGSLYYHAILFIVGCILFVSLKNIWFSDYEQSPLFTDEQVQALQILFVILLVWVAVISFRGYFVKTPEYATRGMFSLILVSLGLFIILLNLLWDPINENDIEIGGFGAVTIAMSSILVFIGMMVYIHVKYTEDRQQKWFIEAVKDSINRMEVTEYHPPARSYGSSRRSGRRRGGKRRMAKPKKQAVEKRAYREPKVEPVKSPMLQPQTTPVQSRPSTQLPAGSTWTPSPTTPNIIKCPQCTMPLKVPDIPTRPLSIRCPHCGSIGVVNE
jgi:hypothetical protein